MTLIESDAELLVKIQQDMKIIIDEATEILLERLKKKIETEVYNKREPKKYVRRKENEGLLDSWTKSEAQIIGKIVQSEVSPDIDRLYLDSDNFTHGSNYWPDEAGVTDIRHLLNEIVIKGTSGPIFDKGRTKGSDDGIPGWWRSPRDFYHPIVDLVQGTWMTNKIAALFRKHGIKGRMIKG